MVVAGLVSTGLSTLFFSSTSMTVSAFSSGFLFCSSLPVSRVAFASSLGTTPEDIFSVVSLFWKKEKNSLEHNYEME